MILQFTVPGLPRPKERPRKGQRGNMYTPRATKNYELEIWTMALTKGARQGCFAGHLLKVDILLDLGDALLDVDGDNVEKAILDGLKPAFNDAYVADMHWQKTALWPQQAVIRVEVLE